MTELMEKETTSSAKTTPRPKAGEKKATVKKTVKSSDVCAVTPTEVTCQLGCSVECSNFYVLFYSRNILYISKIPSTKSLIFELNFTMFFNIVLLHRITNVYQELMAIHS